MSVPDRLFEVPRVVVVVDESDPTVVKLAFSGGVELDRGNPAQIDFYNRLAAGKEDELVVTVHVDGAKKKHKRDGEGFLEDVIETKTIRVTDVHLVAQETQA